MSGTSMATPHVTGLAALIKANNPAAEWRSIKNLILSGGDGVTSLASKTLTGKRINAFASLTCQDSRFFSIIQYPVVVQPGTLTTLSALSINCAAPAGPVIVTLSNGEGITLRDDGLAPDMAAGDGIFTANFTPVRSDESFWFSSPAGYEYIPAPVPAPAPLAITTTTLSGAMVGNPYGQVLAASGGTAPYTWTVATGLLPSGLSLRTDGSISGTPAASGTAAFTVKVVDSKGVTTTRNFTITVFSAPVIITTQSLPPGAIGFAYSTYLGASGGKAPYSWYIQSGSLPYGLSLNTTTGAISGTPSTAGSYSIILRATDAQGTFTTSSLVMQIANKAITDARTGYAYYYKLSASGGTAPYSWTLTGGALPPGLLLASSGVISGTPSKAGSYFFNAKVTDSRGLYAVTTLLLKVL